ncbi:MAG TPA: hypothetical protein VGO56_11785 [Pyrinomonadaceae bacterium]|jgi:hypothetical protein|nr:hypothetical protein [Pyrinomonadaceae bacterium]
MEVEEERFRKKLGKRKSAALSTDLVEYIDSPHDDDFRFDLKVAQRWVLQRVFDLGWSVELFGYFDRYLHRYDRGRESHKPERIGKKYQWIAYYEFLARVADNFKMRGDPWAGHEDENYEGPWQDSYLRGLDPSCLIKKTYYGSGWNPFPPTWWSPVTFSWNEDLSNKDWVRDSDHLPDAASLISTTEPASNAQWLVLESYFHWDNCPDDEDLKPRYPYRNVKYWLQAYLTKKADSDDLYKWMKGNWKVYDSYFLPSSHGMSDIYLGEFFWAPAFMYHNIPYYHHAGWVGGEPGNEIPKPILLTTDQYSHSESGYDCSVDEPIFIHLPCKTISDEMRLAWKRTEGHYYNDSGDLVAFDPSVTSPGPSALLVNKDLFSQYLAEKSYDLIWVVTGEKLIITGDAPGPNWPGRMNILGVYRFVDSQLCGEVTTKLED